MTARIHWPQLNRTITAKPGQTILEAAIEADIDLNHACGGYCACTTCHIHVKAGAENISKMEDEENERIETVGNLAPESRLACQSKVYGDVTVEIP